MIDWGLATRRQMIGGGVRRRRGRLIDKSLFSCPPVEVRALAIAVRVKSPCFCCRGDREHRVVRRPLHRGVPLRRGAHAAPNLTAAWSVGSSAGIESARPTRDVPRPRVQRCRPPRRLPDALGARRRASAPPGSPPARRFRAF
jgi:hypothetical protein